uniref:Breast cancer type 2 susceptibility protein homolog n=1 Tax=Ascaris lumbricoides TaxID=6252 RepID=A0A0M3HZI3_ASCLU
MIFLETSQFCPNAATDDAVNFACPPSLVDSGADCNAASTTEQTINRQLYDALNGILDNLIGEESRWTISLNVPIRQYQHSRGWHSNTTSPTRRMRFHSAKYVRSALGKRNIRYLDYEEECSLTPKRKHWLEDKQAESFNINERLSVSETAAPISPRKSTPVPQDGSIPLLTSFETSTMPSIVPPITKQPHTDKCHTSLTAAEKNFIENLVECCFCAAMTHLQQGCSTVEYSITQRISDAQINSCEEEQLCGEYSARRDIILVTEPQLNDTHALSAKVGGEQRLSETCNSRAGAEIGYFYEETDVVSPKGIEINLEFTDRAQQLETKSRLLAGFTNDASVAAVSSISERVALSSCTHARDILRPSLRIFETTITVSVDNIYQNVFLSPHKTDIDIAQLQRRPEFTGNDRNIEDESHSSSFKLDCSQETTITASDVDASSGAKDSCKENYEALEKRSVQRSHVDLLQNNDGSDFSVTEEDIAPRRLSVLERIALKEQQMKLLKSPQTLILDGAKYRKRASSLSVGTSFNYQNTEGAQTSTIVFHGISVRERVMLKERELKEIERLSSSKFSSKFLRGSHHASRRSISDPTECRREKHDVTARHMAQTGGLHRESEVMSTPILPTNNSKMKGALSEEKSTPARTLSEVSDNDCKEFERINVKECVLAKEGGLQFISKQTPIRSTCSKSRAQFYRASAIRSSKVRNPLKDGALDSETLHEAALRITNHSNFIGQQALNATLQRDASENILHERKQYSSTQAYTEGSCAKDNSQETPTEQVNVHDDENVGPKEGNMINSQCRVSERSLSRDFMQQNSWRIDWSYRFHKIRLIFENGKLEGRKYLDDLRISDEKKKTLDFGNDSEPQKVYQKANEDFIPSNEPEAIHSGKKHSQNCESVEVTNVGINAATNDVDGQTPTPEAGAKLLFHKAQLRSTSDQDLPSEKHISDDRNRSAENEHEHTDHAVPKETEFYRCSVKHLIQLKEDEIKRMDEVDQKKCSPPRLKTLCEEYGSFANHLYEVSRKHANMLCICLQICIRNATP